MGPIVPIIDAHHHIWRLDRTPWLSGPTVPRIFGDYTAIRRDYSIDEYAHEAMPYGVVKSVYVQVNVAPGDEIWEAQWAFEQGAKYNLCESIVAFSDLADPRVEDTLDRLCAAAPVRGIRQQLHWHEKPLYSFASRKDLFLDQAWQRGMSKVAERGLHFELQIFPSQYRDALDLIDRFPGMDFVLLHAGMPDDPAVAARAFWAKGLRAIAERPNVSTKLSALGTFTNRCDADEWATIIHQTVEIFGPRRCIFGSNFPIEKLWTDYASLIAAVRSALGVYTLAEQADILHHNAARLYQLSTQ